MSQLSDAADHIHALAAKYEPLVMVSKLLKEVGSLEAHIPELEAQRNALFDAVDKTRMKAWEAEEAHAAKVLEHEAHLLELSEQSLRLEQAAQAKAQGIIADAEAQAQAAGQVIYDAKLAEVTRLDEQIASVQGQLAQAQADANEASALRDLILAEKVQAEAGLAEVTRTIEQLSKFGSVQGAEHGA